MEIEVQKGDITQISADAIVNPANSLLLMGGGVAGAIKLAGGQSIEDEAVKHAPIPIGQAVLTSAGALPASHVIHAPTMANPAELTNEKNVRLATFASLICADRKALSSLAFPGMGTGVGRVPKEVAARAMVDIISDFEAESLQKVLLIAISDDLFQEFQKAAGLPNPE